MKQVRIVVALLIIAALWYWQQAPLPATGEVSARRSSEPVDSSRRDAPATPQARGPAERLASFLPPEAQQTLRLIAVGGPFPHRQDGNIFQNRERRLPPQARGHYREYTVRTPGERDRGARRIVTGGDPPVEYWYSDDHYVSFRRFEVPR
jgi:ribonuclease T1